nr:MAG TPA: terminase small subunit [Caudoviricetes sp.]
MSKIRLTEQQEKRKHWIIEHMSDYQAIDEPLVDSLAFAIDQLEFMDAQINDVKSLLESRQFMANRDKFVKQVENGLKMLDITPQARNKAKIEVAKTADPLTELLGDM